MEDEKKVEEVEPKKKRGGGGGEGRKKARTVACCDVCAEEFNKTTRHPVQCSFCEGFVACRACCKRYILGAMQDPHCMNCRKEWTLRFMVGAFERVFIDGELRTHRQNVLIDRERSMLSETQRYVEAEMEGESRLEQAEALREERDRIARMLVDIELKSERLVRQATRLKNGDLHLFERLMQAAENGGEEEVENREGNGAATAGEAAEDRAKKVFVQKCRNGDCKGFLSSQWKCGLCKMYTCSHCHEVCGICPPGRQMDATGAAAPFEDGVGMGTGTASAAAAADATAAAVHVCNPENVASVQLMKKDTKNCPNCATPIFRIEGCSQMWCTMCNTAFDWRTGKVETGPIHNPHYFEWRRRMGNGGGAGADGGAGAVEFACGEGGGDNYHARNRMADRFMRALRQLNVITTSTIHTQEHLTHWMRENNRSNTVYERFLVLNPMFTVNTKGTDMMTRTFRNIEHLRLVVIPAQRVNDVEDNRHLRVAYMRNRLSEEDFKKILQASEKKRNKKREYLGIFQLAVTAASDILLRLVDFAERIGRSRDYTISEDNIQFQRELEELLMYCNDSLRQVSVTYKSVCQQFDREFSLCRSDMAAFHNREYERQGVMPVAMPREKAAAEGNNNKEEAGAGKKKK